MCGRSFASRPRALVRLFGSCPNVRYGAPAIVLTCDAAAVPPLETCRPDARENVYEPNACQPRERRFSTATTTPLYVSEYPAGFVNRNLRSAAALAITNTGSCRPSGSVRISSRYTPPTSVQPMKLPPRL